MQQLCTNIKPLQARELKQNPLINIYIYIKLSIILQFGNILNIFSHFSLYSFSLMACIHIFIWKLYCMNIFRMYRTNKGLIPIIALYWSLHYSTVSRPLLIRHMLRKFMNFVLLNIEFPESFFCEGCGKHILTNSAL